jgi:hypothetical protein
MRMETGRILKTRPVEMAFDEGAPFTIIGPPIWTGRQYVAQIQS